VSLEASGSSDGKSVGNDESGCCRLDDDRRTCWPRTRIRSGLTADGSITVHGTSCRAGSRIELGGGVGKAPTGALCGSKPDYFWVG
jgi:hypothetical protein